jgi:hypothetical protein
VGAWGLGSFENDDAVCWLESPKLAIAAIIHNSLTKFLKQKFHTPKILECSGRSGGHEAAEAAAGLLDELTSSGKRRRASCLDLSFEAEQLQLYSLGLDVIREILRDVEYISIWISPSQKRRKLMALKRRLERKEGSAPKGRATEKFSDNFLKAVKVLQKNYYEKER